MSHLGGVRSKLVQLKPITVGKPPAAKGNECLGKKTLAALRAIFVIFRQKKLF